MPFPSLKPYFQHSLSSPGVDPDRLHVCAHSHHPWPDVSLQGHQQAWLDAAVQLDRKWDKIFDEVMPRAQAHLARLLGLADPSTLCFAPNTHEFVMRIISGIDAFPLRVLTTDSEFLSFERQLQRLEETGRVEATRVAVEPFETFSARFIEAAGQGGHDLVFFSQVFYNSGFRVEDLAPLVAAVPDQHSIVVIDGYHAVMAAPVDIGPIAERAFYLGGGYKYAMSGEGVAYLHAPATCLPRPVDTGWFAGFGNLSQTPDKVVAYARDAQRFAGATFDSTGLYRFNAVMDWLQELQITPTRIHDHVQRLQQRFLSDLDVVGHPVLNNDRLLPGAGLPRGNFLTFRHPEAQHTHQQLAAADVVCDVRGDRLRIGFGVYHDADDVGLLLQRIGELPG